MQPEYFQKMSKNLFVFVLETVKGLGRSGYAEDALRLYLQAAQAGFEETQVYEFITQVTRVISFYQYISGFHYLRR